MKAQRIEDEAASRQNPLLIGKPLDKPAVPMRFKSKKKRKRSKLKKSAPVSSPAPQRITLQMWAEEHRELFRVST